tara:strand:+ start:410 stop:1165 length:756 start_codon:yes stop_codon:yes gene_type:complete
MKKIIILIVLLNLSLLARELGQTEITTEEGIEVFQKEKYYILKKNVNIESDTFELYANFVKAYFDKDLYDIVKIESKENVRLRSAKGIYANGPKVNFSIKDEDILVLGKRSSLIYKDINMFSDELIKVNNLTGKFKIHGPGSELKTNSIQIFGSKIDGKYITLDSINEIDTLDVIDEKEVNIITNTMNMFALRAEYNKEENVIELFENVKVIRGNEIIMGDYAHIDTLTDAYKIISNNKEKVKALISSADE